MEDFDAHCPPPDRHPRRPRARIPGGATDCHSHVIGPARQYPFVADRSYTPPDALLTDYLHMLRTLGLERAVLVQPSMHGSDNTVMMSALAAAGIDMRAIVVIPPDIGERDLITLHERGARGVRINLIYSGGNVGIGAATEMAARIRDFGWHLELLADVSQIADSLPALSKISVPLVFDHFGHMPAGRGVASSGFMALLEMVRRGSTWVKLSGAYRIAGGDFPYSDARSLCDALVEANADRMLWGTDWPHTVCPYPMPNDGDLLDLICEWLADDDLIKKVLVANPSSLYRFRPSSDAVR